MVDNDLFKRHKLTKYNIKESETNMEYDENHNLLSMEVPPIYCLR